MQEELMGRGAVSKPVPLPACRRTTARLALYRQARMECFQTFIYLLLGSPRLLNALTHKSSPTDWLSRQVQSCNPSFLFKAPDVFTLCTMLQCKIRLFLIRCLFYFSSLPSPIFKFTSRGSCKAGPLRTVLIL